MLNHVGISKEEALLQYRLAPLKSRRDIAMLGVIHRAVLGEGPDHFRKHFIAKTSTTRHEGRETLKRHDRQLETFRKGNFLEVVPNSILGLVDIYNLLPAFAVDTKHVHEFQRILQGMLTQLAEKRENGWENLFCPRRPLYCHRLREGGITKKQP